MGKLIHPIRNTTQIWIVTRHQYAISVLVSQMSSCRETVGGIAKCHLFSQARVFLDSDLKIKWNCHVKFMQMLFIFYKLLSIIFIKLLRVMMMTRMKVLMVVLVVILTTKNVVEKFSIFS